MAQAAPEDTSLDISELADQAGVTARTIRFYTQQGLLPSPGQTGPGTRYGPGHLARLLLIRRLQRAHLPLAEIRKRIAGMSEAAVEEALEAPGAALGSAVDYVRTVLGGGVVVPGGRSQKPGVSALSALSSASIDTASRKPATERSQWERIALTDDVQLHVRRPLSRDANRRLERLLAQARRIFEEEP